MCCIYLDRIIKKSKIQFVITYLQLNSNPIQYIIHQCTTPNESSLEATIQYKPISNTSFIYK